MIKKILIIAVLIGAVFALGKVVFSAEQAEINELMDLAFKAVMPQEGPDGGAMFVLPLENLPRPYGYENIFFLVHDGGNRFYVTMFRKEISFNSKGEMLVRSMMFVDGGSVLRGNDEFGVPDGKPDRVVFNSWRVAPDGLILEETPESFIDLIPGTPDFEKYLKLFDEGITKIQKFYGIGKGPCQGCE